MDFENIYKKIIIIIKVSLIMFVTFTTKILLEENFKNIFYNKIVK